MTRPKAHLTVTQGDEVGRSYVIRAGQKFLIGRSKDCSISLNDQSVSRHHAAVELTNKGLSVIDFASRNGTKLDEKPLEPNAQEEACYGDILEIGKTSFKIEIFGISELSQSQIQRTRKIPRNFLPTNEFEILGELGRGATGLVYAAKQRALDRNVAIKVPRLDIDDYEDCRQRFIREGRLCSKLDSPYVVRIYDLRMQSNRIFIVMELINGYSALDRMGSKHLIPIHEVAKIGSHVAQALHAMHRMEIIHRDIKPSNILIGPKKIAKLADFGIAKQLGEAGDKLDRLTGSDEGMGTLGYVPPEVADFAELGTYSDVYSLGATLYHLVTGTMPFVTQGASIAEVLGRITYDKPTPVRALRPNCPPDFARLIESMMKKKPNLRPDSITASVVLDRVIKKTSSEPKHLEQTDSLVPSFISAMDDLTDF